MRHAYAVGCRGYGVPPGRKASPSPPLRLHDDGNQKQGTCEDQGAPHKEHLVPGLTGPFIYDDASADYLVSSRMVHGIRLPDKNVVSLCQTGLIGH